MSNRVPRWAITGRPGAHSQPVLAARAEAASSSNAEPPITSPRALTTSLQARLSFINHAELPVMAAAFATKSGQLLVADGRELRLYAGTQQVRRMPLPVTSHNAPVSAIHYNTKGDQFVLVYAASEARIVSNDLGTHADGTLAISQKQILSSAWLDDRQELVTAGSDGTLKYFLTQRHYTVELTGRRLISKLVPRMTIRTEWKWMSHMCADESNGRLFVANEREVLIWHNATGELLQRLPDLHTADMRNLAFCPGSGFLLTTAHDGIIKKWVIAPNGPILIEELHGHAKVITAMATAAQGRLLATCSEDGTRSHPPSLRATPCIFCPSLSLSHSCSLLSLLLCNRLRSHLEHRPRQTGTHLPSRQSLGHGRVTSRRQL